MKMIIGHLYMHISVFITPFSDQFFSTFIISSVYFAIESSLINRYFYASSEYYSMTTTMVMNWCFSMLLQTYYLRRVLTQFFVLQTEAEKTSKTLTEILDNLPDAVLMFENE